LDPENKEPGKDNFWAQAAKYSEVAFIFPAAAVAGLLLGVLFDRWFHTKWFFLVGLVLGVIAGFIQLVRAATISDKDQ
jgi:ATP synthase protein I